jgi:hypothetical protein
MMLPVVRAPVVRLRLAGGLLAAGLACTAAASGAHAQVAAALPDSAIRAQIADPKDKFANLPFNTGAIASQKVLVLPIGGVFVNAAAVRDTAELRRWSHPVRGPLAADSALERALAMRAPEVQWVMSDETRRLAKRAAGLAPPAGKLGQVMLLRTGAKTLPDPLRANLRLLSSMGGGRYALVPADLVFRADESGAVKAVLTLVVGDPRTGAILFRTNAYGLGATPDEALRRAFDATLPPEPTVP